MSHPEFIYDATGKITGYKTPGGADTVFPFSNIKDFFSKVANCIHTTMNIPATDQQATISVFTPGKYYLVFIHAYGANTAINVISGATTIWNIDNGDFVYSRSACLLIKANSASVVFTKPYVNSSTTLAYAFNIFKLD